jgi:hypothetical protein
MKNSLKMEITLKHQQPPRRIHGAITQNTTFRMLEHFT